MSCLDILLVTALPLEHDAARDTLQANGVVLTPKDQDSSSPYLHGQLAGRDRLVSIALARPTRMGATPTAALASSLVERLSPQCRAMSGVCAGNPADVVLGDVIVAECAYQYDEGKRSLSGFEPDHRQTPAAERWVRAAQDFDATVLPTYGTPDESAIRLWLLQQLEAGVDPRKHPARSRYIAEGQWTTVVAALETNGLIKRTGDKFAITSSGRAEVEARRSHDIDPVKRLPYAVHVGPMASGNVVVKDGLTWDMLKALGVRTVLGLEMEAAAIAQVAQRLAVPSWIVAKGVMDYADPKKDDRMKSFAAKASAEVLLGLLQQAPFDHPRAAQASERPTGSAFNVIGNVSGENISITQILDRRPPG